MLETRRNSIRTQVWGGAPEVGSTTVGNPIPRYGPERPLSAGGAYAAQLEWKRGGGVQGRPLALPGTQVAPRMTEDRRWMLCLSCS